MVKLFLQMFPLKLRYSQFILNLGFWFAKSIEEKLSGDFYPVISEDNRNLLQWLQLYKCTQERHGVHKGVLTLGNPAHFYLLQMVNWWLAFSVWENNIIIQMLQKHWSDAFLLSLGQGVGWLVGWLGDLLGFIYVWSTSSQVHTPKKTTKHRTAGVAGCLKIIPKR